MIRYRTRPIGDVLCFQINRRVSGTYYTGRLDPFFGPATHRSITDAYSKINEDLAFQRKVAELAGIGLELPIENREVAPNCTHAELSSTFA